MSEIPENPEAEQNPEGEQNPGTPEAVQDAESMQSPPAPARRRPRAGRIAARAGTVLLLGAVVAGAGYTVVTVQDADRDPGLPAWKFPEPAAAGKKADAQADEAASGLRGLLLPYDEKGYTRGPDLGEFGSDAELSGRQATELRKESLKDLPRKERRQLEKELDKQPMKGMVMRSYYNADGQALYDKRAFFVSVVLARMESRAAAKDVATSQNEFVSALGIFRKGPKPDGHKNAKCFLTPKGIDQKLDRVYCTGYSADVLISVTASGVRPLDTNSIKMFVTAQLDRIDDPGKAV